jgi:ABC-type nitrate/sulfonate/bicarbonate transport system substrate-binding protein
MFPRKSVKRATVPLLLAVAALFLTACGQGADSAESGGKTVVRVVLSEGHSVPFIAADAGNQLGVWDDKDIKVETIAATSSTVGPTMASKQADISLQAGNKAAADIIAGVDSTLVAGCLLPWDQYIVASAKSGADEPADLKGKTFGISGFGSAGHFATEKVAESLGWSKSDFKIVQLGDLDGLLAGLERGTIDSFIWSIEPALSAQDKGFGKVLGSVRDLVGPNAFEAFSVRDEFAEENPEAVKAFFDGYFEAVKMLQGDLDKAEDIVVNDWKNDPSVAERSVKAIVPLLSTDGQIPDDNLQGLGDAIDLTVENSEDFDVTEVYQYWKDLE